MCNASVTSSMRFVLCVGLLVAATSRPVKGQCETKLTPGPDEVGSLFGFSVALGPEDVVVGFPRFRDSNPTFNYNGGAINVFRRAGKVPLTGEHLRRATTTHSMESFGWSVAIDQDRIVVGSPDDSVPIEDAGAVFVFRREADSWIEEAELVASDAQEDLKFGWSVDIDGDRLVVGAFPTANHRNGIIEAPPFGAAYVFRRDGGNWIEEARLIPSDRTNGEHFGASVALSEGRLAVGAPLVDGACPEDERCNSGAVYVFRREGTQWIEEAKLEADPVSAGMLLGFSVALQGATLVAGAVSDSRVFEYAGSAWVFRRFETGWIQQAELVATDPSARDHFGNSVAIDGSLIAVGADSYSSPQLPDRAGAVFLYVNDGNDWIEQGRLFASDGEFDDDFGFSVAVFGSDVAVGAEWHPGKNHQNLGAAYVFTDVLVPPSRDVNADGIVDLSDILCVLDGFSGSFVNCPFEAVDIARASGQCVADGMIDLADILMILDAFAGTENCCAK